MTFFFMVPFSSVHKALKKDDLMEHNYAWGLLTGPKWSWSMATAMTLLTFVSDVENIVHNYNVRKGTITNGKQRKMKMVTKKTLHEIGDDYMDNFMMFQKMREETGTNIMQ